MLIWFYAVVQLNQAIAQLMKGCRHVGNSRACACQLRAIHCSYVICTCHPYRNLYGQCHGVSGLPADPPLTGAGQLASIRFCPASSWLCKGSGTHILTPICTRQVAGEYSEIAIEGTGGLIRPLHSLGHGGLLPPRLQHRAHRYCESLLSCERPVSHDSQEYCGACIPEQPVPASWFGVELEVQHSESR